MAELNRDWTWDHMIEAHALIDAKEDARARDERNRPKPRG